MKSQIYILNIIQMEPSRSHRLIYVIDNCDGPQTIQYE